MKFFSYIKQIFSIKELYSRISNTVFCIMIFRLGSYVALPGIDIYRSHQKLSGLLGFLDVFLGGTFNNISVFSLGVMPYISASIAVNLLTVVVPYFQRLQKDNESGRNRLNSITRLLAILIGVFQALGYLSSPIVRDEFVIINKLFFIVSSIIILVSGSMFCIWLGDVITNWGIGNGVSILMMVNIVSSLPGALIAELTYRGSGQLLIIILELVVLFFIILFIVSFNQAVRKIPIQYAKQVTSQNLYNSSRQYIPIKLSMAGVMPIIFAQTIMFLPPLIAGFWNGKSDLATAIIKVFSDFTSWQYNVILAILIISFSFFYTAITVNSNKIAEDMKQSNSFIPGIKPGKNTAEFIDNVLIKLILPGSLFLIIIAIMPGIAHILGITKEFSRFYGGTSLIIMVSVAIDIIQTIQSYFIMGNYSNANYYSNRIRELL